MVTEIGSAFFSAGLASLVTFNAFKIRETKLNIVAGATLFLGLLMLIASPK